MDSKFLMCDGISTPTKSTYGCCEHVGSAVIDFLKKKNSYWAYVFDFSPTSYLHDSFKNLENIKIYLEYMSLLFDIQFEHITEKPETLKEDEEAFKIIGVVTNKHFIMPHCFIRYMWWPMYHNIAIIAFNLYKNFKTEYPLENYIAIASSFANNNSRTAIPIKSESLPYLWFFPSLEIMVKQLKKNTIMHTVSSFGPIYYTGQIDMCGGFFEDYSEKISLKNFLSSLGSEEMDLATSDMIKQSLDKYQSAKTFAQQAITSLEKQYQFVNQIILSNDDIFNPDTKCTTVIMDKKTGASKTFNLKTLEIN